MQKRKSPFIQLLKGLGLFLGILVVLLYLVLPAGMGVVALLPGNAVAGSPPVGFETVTLQTEDGVWLQGWYRPPENGAAILLLHGAGGSKESTQPYAEMLVKQGYGVLALDLRGHGGSAGKTNRLGWQGTLDVGAAVRYLQTRDEVKWIGGLGSSMGGEVLLGAAATYPQIEAIAADGATRRCLDEYLTLDINHPLVRNFTARVMYATVELFSGERPPQPLLQSMVAAETSRFLLIAGGDNSLEVSFNRLFEQTLAGRAALWVAPEAGHIAAFYRYPQEYEQRVIAFFDSEHIEAQSNLRR
jgi:pimeloyl-ACP methyl ester carboxylesterase